MANLRADTCFPLHIRKYHDDKSASLTLNYYRSICAQVYSLTGLSGFRSVVGLLRSWIFKQIWSLVLLVLLHWQCWGLPYKPHSKRYMSIFRWVHGLKVVWLASAWHICFLIKLRLPRTCNPGAITDVNFLMHDMCLRLKPTWNFQVVIEFLLSRHFPFWSGEECNKEDIIG